MALSLYKKMVGKAFVHRAWNDFEFGVITSVRNRRVYFTRVSTQDPKVQIPSSTTTLALRALEQEGTVVFSPIPGVEK